MKKIAIIIIFFLVSCKNTYIEDNKMKEVADKEALTTKKIINSMDTNEVYHIYVEKSKLYVIDKQNQVVKYVVVDNSGEAETLFILFLGGVLLSVLVGTVLSSKS